jgi:hypothetical protein
MSKKFLLIILALFLVLFTVQGALAVNLTDGLVSYWSADTGTYSGTTVNDLVGSNDGTANYQRIYGTDGKINEGFDFTQGNDYVNINQDDDFGIKTFSISGWFKKDAADHTQAIISRQRSNQERTFMVQVMQEGILFFGAATGSSENNKLQILTNNAYDNNQWHHFVFIIVDGKSAIAYIDNIIVGSDTSLYNSVDTSSRQLNIGRRPFTNDRRFNGFIDELAIYNRALSSDEVSALYNSGTGYQPIFETNFSVSAKNIFNNINIQSFNVSTNESDFWNTTTGLINTDYEFNDTIELDLYVCAESYFCEWYNNTVINTSLISSLKQSIINLSVFNLLGDPVSNWSLYNGSTLLLNTTNSSGIVYLPEGNYSNIIIKSNDGGFTQQELDGFIIDPLDEKTINFTIVNYLLKVFAKDILTNATINNYSIIVKDLINLFDHNFSTTTGEISEFMLDSVYNITINADGYSLHDNIAIVNVSADTNHTFYLYTDNSVQLIIKNEGTGALITQQVNITLTGEQVYTFTTSTGSKYIDNLIPGTYSVKLESAGFSIKYYSITVGSRSFQTLTTYLTTATGTVTFNLRDSQTQQPIESVFVSMTRWVNDSWVIVESKLTDIIGKVVFTYMTDTSYRFVAQKDGYVDRVFTLNPVTESEYIVNMVRVDGSVVVISDVSVSYDPSLFVEGVNNFSFTIQSPLGNLVNYSLRIVYPGGEQVLNGVNAIGENFETSFIIVNPSFFDKVYLYYDYFVSDGTRVSKVIPLSIQSDDVKKLTFIRLKGNDYGLGIIERMILTVVIVVLLAGVTFMFAGAGAGLVVGMLIYGFFVVMGFIPLWSIIITLLVGFVVLAKIGGS